MQISWSIRLVLMVELLESHLSLYISGLDLRGNLKYAFLAFLAEARAYIEPTKLLSPIDTSQYISGCLTQSVPY